MWNPSEKEAKKAFDYASKSPSNYNKMNEMGKRAFWQYGRDKGIFNLNTLSEKAKAEYSKYVTDDMPYASKNPMERATLARQSEQGQFDDSEQVKASKLQDRRLLNESRLEALTPEIKPQPMQLPQQKNDKQKKTVVQQGKIAPKDLERPDNPFAPALVPFANQLAFGALERNTDAVADVSAKNPVASTIGNIAGYGAKFAMLGGANSALSSPLTKGIANPVVKRIAGEAITGMGIDAIEEVVKGKNDLKTAGKNIAMGAVYGIIADTALEGAGRLIKALGKKYGKNMPEQVVQTIAKMQDIEAKPEKTNADVEEYYNYIGYLDEVNRKSPDYIKAEARMNVPKAKEIKTLTKTIGEPEKTIIIDKPFENAINKVSTKKIKLTPEESQLNDILKRTNTNIDEFISEAENIVKDLEERQFQYLKNNKAKGVQQANVIRDNTGTVTGRFGRVSNNDRWYREFYAENGRPPNNAELREIAKEHLMKGFGTDTMYIPANEEYIQALKDLESYRNIKTKNATTPVKTNEVFYTPSKVEVIKNPTNQQYQQMADEFVKEYPQLAKAGEPKVRRTYDIEGNEYIWKSTDDTHYGVEKYIDNKYKTLTHQNKYFDVKYDDKIIAEKKRSMNPQIKTSTTVQKGTIPTPQLIPSTLQTKGQTLKPNKPILSALDAKVNKPYTEPIRPILDLPKTPVEAPKVSGGINTLPMQNKSLTGAIKASDETLPKRKFGDTPKGDILEGMKERGFSKNIRTDTAMPDDIRIDFDDSPLAYKQVGNPETLSKAENIMKNGQSQAMSQYYELLSKNKPESVPLAKLIAKNAEAAGDIDTARRVLADAAEKLTEAGQFSQAAKILRESDPETFLMTVDKQLRKLNEQGLKQYGKKWADIDLLPNEITAIQNIPRGNQQAYEEVWEQIGSRIAKQLPSTGMEKFDAWRRMAMLLNPKTHIRNTLGNVFMVGMRKTSDTLGAGLEKLFRIKERTKSFGWSQNKDIVSKVEETWNTVKKDILGESRWEIDNIKSLGREKNIFKNKTLQGLNEFSLKTLNAEDNIFTQRAFKDALGQFMQSNRLAEPTDAALAYAKRRALESTYKQANKLATWINQAKQIPVAGKFVEAAIPFTKTPANIMKTTFEYSPAGLIKLIFSKGKPPAEVIETLAKGLTGTSITGLGFWLASMGYAKTQNSKSAKKTAIDTEMGEQPYSITTPQGSYTFDWAQPIAVPFAMGIAMYESIKDKENIDLDAITDSIAQGGDSLFNMSMLQNIKQFLGYGSTTENILGLPWNYVQQAWPSLFGQVAKTVDDTKRSTYDPNPQKQTWNRLKSRIPFASKSLEPSLNVWGEEQKQGGIIQQFINPGYTREKSNDPVTIEISRLYAEYGDNDMLPKMAQNFKIEGKTTKLSPGDMTEFQRKMGQENHTEINRLISSAQYQLLSDKEKMKKIKKIVNDNYEEAKEGIIKKMK